MSRPDLGPADISASTLVIGANDLADEPHDEPAERRAHQRGVAVLKAAKLICGRETLCLIRNISAAGLMADIYHPVPAGTKVVVLLTEDQPVSGKVAWSNGQAMGVRFDQEIDLAAVLAALAQAPDGRRARLPRLDVDAWARMRVGARVFSARLCNISQGGARLRIHGLNSPGAVAVLSMNRFRPVQGIVRWCHATLAGISFNQHLGLRELMHWLETVETDRR